MVDTEISKGIKMLNKKHEINWNRNVINKHYMSVMAEGVFIHLVNIELLSFPYTILEGLWST